MQVGNARRVSLIATLIPASASAEMFSDVPESTMFSDEAAAVAGAGAERRREFGTVRWCARKALRQLGVPAVPILPDGDRAPRWPVGVVGSMTHCAESYVDEVVMVEEPDDPGLPSPRQALVPLRRLDPHGCERRGRMAGRARHDDTTAVASAPDLGERYLDTVYQPEWVEEFYGEDVLETEPRPSRRFSRADRQVAALR
jgi:hypothetical protein